MEKRVGSWTKVKMCERDVCDDRQREREDRRTTWSANTLVDQIMLNYVRCKSVHTRRRRESLALPRRSGQHSYHLEAYARVMFAAIIVRLLSQSLKLMKGDATTNTEEL